MSFWSLDSAGNLRTVKASLAQAPFYYRRGIKFDATGAVVIAG